MFVAAGEPVQLAPGTLRGRIPDVEWIGDDRAPIVRGVAVPLGDGARIYLGSWTRITFRPR